MLKNQTKEIQNFMKDLGEYLGLISKMEVRLHRTDNYSPIYDVVWFLDLRKDYNLDMMKKFVNDEECIENIKLLPIAVFEIEGAATSSKNQIGNLSNLTFSDTFLKFVIVNNEAAIPEKDTYRRGLKIVRYFENNFGAENIIFLDWNYIKDTYDWLTIKDTDKHVFINENKKLRRSGSGGESKSIDIFNRIFKNALSTGLEIKQDYTPSKCKLKYYTEDYIGKTIDIDNDELNLYLKRCGVRDPNKNETYMLRRINDRYYLPKLDIVLGFNLPIGIIKWLKGLGDRMGQGMINNPTIFYLKHSKEKSFFVPLISMEIETSVSKHLNGGVINMWKSSYIGILVSNKTAEGHINFFRNHGCNNVYLYDFEGDD